MPTGINLTPPQEIKRQKTQLIVGASTKLSILFFIVLAGVGAFFFYKSYTLKNQIASLDKQKTDLILQRDSMKDVESYAKKLSGKYFLLQKYLESRLKYSSVMVELTSRIPTGVLLENIGFEGAGKRTKVSGTSADVVQVSSFVSRLSKDGNASTESAVSLTGKNAFTDVRLDSLNVEEGKPVEYSVSFKVNEEVFLK